MGVCVSVSLMSVTSALASRLWQMGVCVRVPYVSYIGFSRLTLADVCVCVSVSLMSVTSGLASRLWQMGVVHVCVRVCVLRTDLVILHMLLFPSLLPLSWLCFFLLFFPPPPCYVS